MEVYFPYQDIVYDQGDDVGDDDDVPDAPRGHFQSRVFQQSVTLTARMWPDDEGLAATAAPGAAGGAGGWKWGSWRVPGDQVAALVGAVCGGALVLVLVLAVIAWRCCILPRRHKSYCTRIAEELASRHRGGMPVYHNQCAVFADPKKGHWAYNSRLVSGAPFAVAPPTHWFYNSRVLGFPAEPMDCPCPEAMSRSASYGVEPRRATPPRDRKRPLSQPIRFSSCDLAAGRGRRHPGNPPLPDISEFSAQRTQFASSSISFILTVLDDVDRCRGLDPLEPTEGALKTRSLPAWVRSRPRPLSTEDNLADLYAKVNFSKKRKNRMRNDEAAIIALSKSRSQFLHKDTDSLVDNEAVIVYNERTAL